MIRYTEYGIPHILANNYRDLGTGVGFAQARDNVCLVSESVVTTRAERSRFFGPNGTIPGSLAIASTTSNLNADLYFQGINNAEVVERLVEKPAPLGPNNDLRNLVAGYVDGFNRYLRENQVSDPNCKDAAWVRPIQTIDVYRRMYHIGMLLGQGTAVDGIAAARPPVQTTAGIATTPSIAGLVMPADEQEAASNAIAVGNEGSATNRGIMLSNPHLSHTGDLRVWEAQLTIPGKINVSGSFMLGLPYVLLGGYNETMSWSTTVSTAAPFTLFELKLAPGQPTTYQVDGKSKSMERRSVTVTIKGDNGQLQKVTRNQYWTDRGPVVTQFRGLTLPWTSEKAYVLADANATNMRWGNQMLDIAKSRTTDEALAALNRWQGSGFINMLFTDAGGQAAYSQMQVIPNVTNEHAERCNTALGSQTFGQGLIILDGSRSSCAWARSQDAVQPGTFGPSQLPVLRRSDYVMNSNDSYWMVNHQSPLTGFPRIVGPDGTELSLRTRMGLTAITEQLTNGKFTRQAMQDLVQSNRALSADLVLADTVRMCRELPNGQAQGSAGMVDVSGACPALEQWHGAYNVDSRGALLFGRYWLKAVQYAGGGTWAVPFNRADPIHTPNTLNVNNPQVQRALADAVTELNGLNIPLDAPLGEHQFFVRNGERIPVGGAHRTMGVYNRIDGIWDPQQGAYTQFGNGPTHIQVVSFNGTTCPDVRTQMTYSQSSDSTSPHSVDQTKLYVRKEWVTGRFCEADIAASPNLEIVRLK
jgi:acyl-homoserine-lactone acylase